jgi:capsular polysaccharide biosynthesis protein
MMTVDKDPTNAEPQELLRRAAIFVRRALRFWYAPLLALAVGALVVVGLFWILKPAYRSEIVILATEGVRPVDASEQATAPRSVAARIQEIVTSRPQLGRAVEQFDLYPEIRKNLGAVDAVDELRKHVQFKALGGDTFKIAFEGASPLEAQRVTSRLAELVIEEDSRLRNAQAGVTQGFFVAEKARTETQLNDAEHELASFMAAHPRFAVDTTPLVTGAAVRASQALAPGPGTAFAPRARMPWQPGTVQPGATPPGAARRPSSEEASAQATLVAARTNLAEKLAHFTPAHPDVRIAQATVGLAEAQLAAVVEAADPNGTPEAANPASAAAAPRPNPVRYQPMQALPATPAKPGEDLVALETDWDRLTRAVIEARQRHGQVEVALFKADIAASSELGSKSARMTVIDPAYLPQRPVPPGQMTLAAIVLGIALGIGLLIALGCAALDDRIYTERDVDRIGYVLVEVPRIRVRRRTHVTT